MSQISALIIYSRVTVGTSHHKNLTYLIHCLKFLEGRELEVLWSGIKQWGLEHEEIERKWICGNAHCSFI